MLRSVSSRFVFTLVTITAFSSMTFALESNVRTHDSDLAGSPVVIQRTVPLEIKPDSMDVTAGTHPLSLQVLRMDHGATTPVAELGFTMDTPAGKIQITTNNEGVAQLPGSVRCEDRGAQIKGVAELSNRHFQIENTDSPRTYRIVADLPCTGSARMVFKSDSDGGQVLGIWQIATRARAKLQQAIGLDFWKSKITFKWPDTADYYSWGEVHITRGDYWDVVGHEMGHAIYDLGSLGQFGGGEHKIDECYSNALALSEGWASFFSGWVSVNMADPDAKFEYMVPRRAPIRFENVPEDVCKGESNEWRVTGFFWDIIDSHDDGETVNEPFAKTWNAMLNSHVPSASAAFARLQKAGFDIHGLQTVWELNFRSPIN